MEFEVDVVSRIFGEIEFIANFRPVCFQVLKWGSVVRKCFPRQILHDVIYENHCGYHYHKCQFDMLKIIGWKFDPYQMGTWIAYGKILEALDYAEDVTENDIKVIFRKCFEYDCFNIFHQNSLAINIARKYSLSQDYLNRIVPLYIKLYGRFYEKDWIMMTGLGISQWQYCKHICRQNTATIREIMMNIVN